MNFLGPLRMMIGMAALAATASACASTGAIPRPFPIPGGAPALPAPPASPRASRDPQAALETLRYDTYALVGTALSLRGAAYRNGGSDPSGFDCSGFTQYVFAQHGIRLPRAVRDQFVAGHLVDSGELAPGDLVFFATSEGPSHVAIAVGGDEFVHAPSSTGVVRVEHLTAPYWSARYLGARRMD